MGLDAGVSLARFLLRLAECNLGLVVITTREHLVNVAGRATTEEQKLDKLSQDAADRWHGGGAACGGEEHSRLRALCVSASGHLLVFRKLCRDRREQAIL